MLETLPCLKIDFWILDLMSGFWDFSLDFWRYLGNEKSYRRSAGVKMTGFARAFQISAWITWPERPKGTKDEVKRPEGPPTTSLGPEGQ